MDPIGLALNGVVLPGALALGIVGVFAATGGRGEGSPRRTWRELAAPRWAGLAVAAAFSLGFALTLGWPALPPVDVTQVGPWAALAAVPLAWLPGRWRALATGVIGLGLGLFLASPLHSGGALMAQALFIGASVLAMERGLTWLGRDQRAREGGLATLVFVSAAAAVILMSDTASLALVTGGLAAGLGALVVTGFIVPGFGRIGAAAPVLAVVLGTHLHSAALFANGRYDTLVVVALAPLATVLLIGRPWVRAPRPTTARATGFRLALPAALMLIPLGAATAVSATRYFGASTAEAATGDPSSQADDADYGY